MRRVHRLAIVSAVAALLAGGFWLITLWPIGLLLALVSVFTGHVSYRALRNLRTTARGSDLAFGGLTLGYVALILCIFTAGFWLARLPYELEQARRRHEQNVQRVAMSVLRGHYLTGCFAYAADHQARLPPDLQTLVDQRYLGAIEYDLPGKDIILRPALLQAGQILNELPPQTIVLSETQAFTNACLVIRADGSSKLLSPQDYQAEMNANGPSPEAVVTPPPDGRPGAGGAGP